MKTKQQIAQQRANLAIAEFLKELFTPPYVISESTFDETRNLQWSVPNRMSMPHLLLKERKR